MFLVFALSIDRLLRVLKLPFCFNVSYYLTKIYEGDQKFQLPNSSGDDAWNVIYLYFRVPLPDFRYIYFET